MKTHNFDESTTNGPCLIAMLDRVHKPEKQQSVYGMIGMLVLLLFLSHYLCG